MYELSEGIGSQLINMDKEATGVQGWKRRGGGGGGCKGGGGGYGSSAPGTSHVHRAGA